MNILLNIFRKQLQNYLLLLRADLSAKNCREIKCFTDNLSSPDIILLVILVIPLLEAQQTITHWCLHKNRGIKFIWSDHLLSLRHKHPPPQTHSVPSLFLHISNLHHSINLAVCNTDLERLLEITLQRF
jgi:hypothetical protein